MLTPQQQEFFNSMSDGELDLVFWGLAARSNTCLDCVNRALLMKKDPESAEYILQTKLHQAVQHQKMMESMEKVFDWQEMWDPDFDSVNPVSNGRVQLEVYIRAVNAREDLTNATCFKYVWDYVTERELA